MTITMEREKQFTTFKECLKTDTEGRIALGKAFSDKNYNVSKSEEGVLLLTPVGDIPERDRWLYENPEALAMFRQGLAEAAAGLAVGGVDFTQYADEVLEED